jgi:predicted transcriptional regulator
MDTQDPRAPQVLIRTSVLIPEDVDTALRKLAADADRPLSREIRRALDDYVAREQEERAA